MWLFFLLSILNALESLKTKGAKQTLLKKFESNLGWEIEALFWKNAHGYLKELSDVNPPFSSWQYVYRQKMGNIHFYCLSSTQKKILEKQKKIEIYVFLWFIFFYAYTKVAFFAPLPFHALAEQRTHISTAHFHILLFQLWLLVCWIFILFSCFFSKILLQNNCSIVCSFWPHRGVEIEFTLLFRNKVVTNIHEYFLFPLKSTNL